VSGGAVTIATRALAALSVAVFSALGATDPVRAENCGPLAIVASVDLVPTTDNTLQFVPVSIGDAKRLMLVDTGGFVSEITPQAVEELRLSHRELGFEQINVAGEMSREAALVPSFRLGELSAASIEFVIAPEKKVFVGDKRFVGIIGPDILRSYDVDMDFGAHRLNLMSPDHCEGKVVYWHPSALAVLPMDVLRSGHIAVTVTIDGKPERALLDTGADESTLALPIAEGDFHLKAGTPDMPYVFDLQGKPGSSVYTHRFSSVSFGSIAAASPQFAIVPDLVGHPLELQATTGTRFIDADARDETAPVLIGMDILRHLHLYIAYKEHKLYVAPAPSDRQATSASAGTAAE